MISLKKKKINPFWLIRWYRKFIHKYIVLIVAWIMILLLSIILPRYFNQSSDLITKVLYTTKSLSLYDDPWLYTTLSSFYKQKTSLSLKRFGSRSLERQIISEIPYISSIVIKNINSSSLTLDVAFTSPPLVVSVWNKRFALYSWLFLPLYSGNALGNSSPLLFLPSYLSGKQQNLSWLLYMLPLEKLASDVVRLTQLPFSGMVTYIPGGEKYIYRNERRHIYFNAKKSLTGQIDSLMNLMTNYQWFNNLTRIDLWSNDLITVR